MAHKKAGGSSSNGRDSNGQRRGVKSYGGDKIKALSHALGFISYITRGLEKGQKLIVEKDYKIFGITLYTRRREVLLNEYLFAQQA